MELNNFFSSFVFIFLLDFLVFPKSPCFNFPIGLPGSTVSSTSPVYSYESLEFDSLKKCSFITFCKYRAPLDKAIALIEKQSMTFTIGHDINTFSFF